MTFCGFVVDAHVEGSQKERLTTVELIEKFPANARKLRVALAGGASGFVFLTRSRNTKPKVHPMSNGNVYVFNATPNTALLLLNEHILSASLAGVLQSSSYVPASVSAPRNPAAGNPGVAQFGGTNTLVVSFPAGSSQQYTVNIDSTQQDYSLQNDLELYVFYNEVILVSPFGSASLPGTPLTEPQKAMVEKVI